MTATNDDLPKLIAADEAWTVDEENPQFAFMAYVWRLGQDHYHLRHYQRGDSPYYLFSKADRIPREYYMPCPLPKLTQAPRAIEDHKVYRKQPALVDYEPGSTRVAENVLHEAEICEILMKNPHSNVCKYFGYVPSEDNRIVALCFQRHDKTLRAAVNEGKIDIETIVSGVKCGVEHLHSLGLVHNDIKPDNLLIDECDQPVIIDFDSCWPVGESLKGKKVGTTENESSFLNDNEGVKDLEKWLNDKMSNMCKRSQ